MTLKQFAAAMNRQPFQPFTLVVAGGSPITIDAPEFASINRSGSIVRFNTPDGRVKTIDASLVVRIETDEAGTRG